MKKIIYKILGFIAFGFGIVGAFIPLLPTTPFLLLSAFFFARSSQRWYDYLHNHKIFGKYLSDYENKQMTISNKVRTLLLMWAGMIFAMWLAHFKLVMVIVLTVIGVGVSIHLLMLKNPEIKPEHTTDNADQN